MRISAPALCLLAASAFSFPSACVSAAASEHVAPSLRGGRHAAPHAAQSFGITVFARGTTTYYNPDPIVVDKDAVYVAYQNATQPDGSGGYSTIVQYRHDGTVVRGINLLGHCDGMRENPTTHALWALMNNDANPVLFTIAPGAAPRRYTFVGTQHGGGYDDLAFTGGKAFVSGSNPTLNAQGINVHPAVYGIYLSGDKAFVRPVLAGNQSGVKDIATGSSVTINEIDPDSMAVDLHGDVELVNQGGSELVYIQNPGTAQQSVSRLLVGTQLEDTIYAPAAKGTLFLVDITANAVYTLTTNPFVTGTLYTIAPSDSGVASFFGSVDPSTGTVTPLLTGFASPTGLVFAPPSVFP